MYKVRTRIPPWRGGEVIIIHARGYNDAVRLRRRYGGKIMGKPKRKGWKK